jgi:hypothetical protein
LPWYIKLRLVVSVKFEEDQGWYVKFKLKAKLEFFSVKTSASLNFKTEL